MCLTVCTKTSYVKSNQVPDKVANYRINDTVFEDISVPYKECKERYTIYVSPNGDNKNNGTSLETIASSVKQHSCTCKIF